jgi:DNA primase
MRRGLSVAQQTLDREYVVLPKARNWVALQEKLKSELRIAVLPAGYDLDDLLRKEPETWPKLLDGAQPVMDYLIQLVIGSLDISSAKDKEKAKEELLPLIRDIPNLVERQHYIQLLARRLQVNENALINSSYFSRVQGEQIVRARQSKSTSEFSEFDVATQPTKPTRSARSNELASVVTPTEKFVFGPEEYGLALLLLHPTELVTVEQLGLQASDFARTEHRQIFEAFKQWCAFNDPTQLGALRETLAEVLWARFDALSAYTPSGVVDVLEIEKATLRLRERAIRQQIERLRFLEDEARRSNAVEDMQEYRQLILNATEHLKWAQDALYARSSAARIH